MPSETIKMKVQERFQLRKWDGDPPKPGEDKPPVEIITFGDGIPTTINMLDNGRLVAQEVLDSFTQSVLENRK